MAAECPICVAPFNRSTRKHVVCGYCQFDYCTECAKRIIIDSPQDPHCTQCRHPWSFDFMCETFTKKFVNTELKEHRRKQLFERELSLMPATQLIIEREIEIRRRKEAVRGLKEEVAKVKAERDQVIKTLEPQYQEKKRLEIAWRKCSADMLKPGADMENLLKQRREDDKAIGKINKSINGELRPLTKRIKELNKEIYRLMHPNRAQAPAAAAVPEVLAQAEEPKEERRTFTRACPAPDCRGFLSTRWKCGICSVNVCSDCHEIKKADEEHECKPENLESAKLISKDSKPCPTCGAMSIKILGCAQVFCIGCQTAWNWNTGRVEKGAIHAADYFTFIQRMGRQRTHGDVPCGGMPDAYHVHANLMRVGIRSEVRAGMSSVPMEDGRRVDLGAFQRDVTHMYAVQGRIMRPDVVNDNQDLRVKYMLNEITVEQFKRYLHMREKAALRKRELYQIIQTTYEVASDGFRVIENAESLDEVQRVIREFMALSEYAAESVHKIAVKYNSVVLKMPTLRGCAPARR